MTRRLAQILRLLAIPSLFALGVVTAPAVSAGNPCFHDFAMPPATSDTGNEIKLMPCAFEPTVTQVAVGTEVTFMQITKYTHACVRLERDGRVLVIDPGEWSEPEALTSADAVLVTHEHSDHIEMTRLAAAGIRPDKLRSGRRRTVRADRLLERG